MCCAARPLDGTELLQTFDKVTSVTPVTVEAALEIHTQEEIVRILVTGEIGLDYWGWVSQHHVEPLEEERMHMREVTCVLVSRPSFRRRAAPEDRRWYFANERLDDVGSARERVDYGCGVHPENYEKHDGESAHTDSPPFLTG